MAIKILRQIVDAAGRWMRVGPRTVILQSTTDDRAGVWGVADEADGAQYVKPVGSVAGGTAAPFVGVSGRLPQSATLTIAAGKTISARPLRGGVSVIGANGAAAAVSATGKVVTLTAKNDGTTTVTAMIALIAASSTVAPLLAISGTGADLFDATWSVAETPLWAAGTIPANLMCALGSDGYNWPVETDNTGGIKTSDSSLNHGEGDMVPPLRTITKGTRVVGAAAANAAVTGAGTLLQLNVSASTAGTVRVYDALTATGTPICVIRCLIGTTMDINPCCAIGTGLTVEFADSFAGNWGLTFKAD